MDKLEKLIQSMDLNAKIGQLTQYTPDLLADTEAELTGPVAAYGLTKENLAAIGSIISIANADEMKKLQDAHLANDPYKIPIVFMCDVIHGYRTIFPIPLALAGSFDPELVEACSEMAAKEASLEGTQVTFSPMVDYVRDPRWGRVMETGGEEPLLTAAIAQAQIRGYQGDNVADKDRVAACVKHYAGYGGAEAGRDYNVVELSPRELYQFYLPAYKACIDAGAKLLMPSFNSLNGIPSIGNSFLMKKVLKEEWHYDGAVISDWGAIDELQSHGIAADQKDAALKAFKNGCDIEMCTSAYFHHLKALLEEGAITEDEIDKAVYRVLELKDRLGLFEDPYHGADEKKAAEFRLSPENRSLARKAAEESAVLLKNNGLLPLDKSIKKIALIGPFADNHAIKGSWSCKGQDVECVTVLEGIKNLLPNAEITCIEGCTLDWQDKDLSGIPAAVAAAKVADAVILCLGESQGYSGEGTSRTDLSLDGVQMELAKKVIEANEKTAVLLFNGRPLIIPELDDIAPAILDMFFPGTEGGNAAARLLFGDANPCGKLSMTFPYAMGQIPIYYNRLNTGRPHWTSDIQYRPYTSNYIDCPTLPLYSFGHGLSYSDFAYRSMEFSEKTLAEGGEIQLTVRLANESDVPGKEVVQVYMRDMVGSVVRPLQQLIAFKKVSLGAHEEKEVTFTLTDDMFRFYDMEAHFIREPGVNRIMVGSADQFKLIDEINII